MTTELDFYGAINLVDWWQHPETDQSFHNIVGTVRIVPDTEVGFKIRTNGQANYIVSVTGPSGEVVSFPGCKVFGFINMAKTMDRELTARASTTTYIVK